MALWSSLLNTVDAVVIVIETAIAQVETEILFLHKADEVSSYISPATVYEWCCFNVGKKAQHAASRSFRIGNV